MTDTLIITDTGKRRTVSASAEETDLANSGSAITLHGIELTVEEQGILNTNPVVGQYTTSSNAGTRWASGEVDTIGAHKPKWMAKGYLDDTSSTDMALVQALRQLPRTKGYKTLAGDLPDWSNGSDDSSTVNVHVASVKIRHQSSDNLVSYEIEMYETT